MKGPRSVEDWFEFVPNLLSDSGRRYRLEAVRQLVWMRHVAFTSERDV